MTCGGTMISLHEDAAHDMADINVYRNEMGGILEIFNQLPRLFGQHAEHRQDERR